MIRLFGVSIAGSVLLLVLSETVLIAFCYLSAMYLVFGVDTQSVLVDDGGWLPILVLLAVIQLGLYFNDLYEDFRPRLMLLQQVCLVLGAAFILQAVFGYGRSRLQVHKWTMVFGSAFVLVAIPAWRQLYYRLARNS